jgi:hypothetical protein
LKPSGTSRRRPLFVSSSRTTPPGTVNAIPCQPECFPLPQAREQTELDKIGQRTVPALLAGGEQLDGLLLRQPPEPALRFLLGADLRDDAYLAPLLVSKPEQMA